MDTAPEPHVVGFLLLVEALLLWRFLVNLKRYRSLEYKAMQQKSREEWNAYKAEAPQRRAARAKEREWQAKCREWRREEKAKDRQPAAAVLISTQNTTGKHFFGTAARTALGGALFGVFGAAVGMASSRQKLLAQKATFRVRYASGRTSVETVDVQSARFQELAALLPDEEP